MDYIEILTLYEMIRKHGLEEEVAKNLKIKKSSFRRQMNRIKAYHLGSKSQKRSGKKIATKYSEAMREVLERKIGQPAITRKIETNRRLQFTRLEDLLNYRQPVAHISSIRFDNNIWELHIAINSAL